MKCTKIQRIILERDPDELTAEATSHLEACPDCGQAFRRACTCRSLVALKRYEQPSELRREACLAALHDRLVRLPEPLAHEVLVLHPVFRYGVAAAFLILAGAQFAAISGVPPLRSPVTQADLRSRTFQQFMTDRQSLMPGIAAEPPLFETFATFPSNMPPATARPASVFFVGD